MKKIVEFCLFLMGENQAGKVAGMNFDPFDTIEGICPPIVALFEPRIAVINLGQKLEVDHKLSEVKVHANEWQTHWDVMEPLMSVLLSRMVRYKQQPKNKAFSYLEKYAKMLEEMHDYIKRANFKENQCAASSSQKK